MNMSVRFVPDKCLADASEQGRGIDGILPISEYRLLQRPRRNMINT